MVALPQVEYLSIYYAKKQQFLCIQVKVWHIQLEETFLSPILMVALSQVAIVTIEDNDDNFHDSNISAGSVWPAIEGPAVRRDLRRDAHLLRFQAPHPSHRILGRLLPQVPS